MHSAVYAVARCLSVCLSVTHRYSVEVTKHILKLFTVGQAHYSNITIRQYSDRDPVMEASNGRGMKTSSSAVAKRPRDASCLSVVSFNSTKRRVQSFCRAMLCISAAYAVMRCLCVCLCVRLSVPFMDHVKTNKRIFNIFHRRTIIQQYGD